MTAAVKTKRKPKAKAKARKSPAKRAKTVGLGFSRDDTKRAVAKREARDRSSGIYDVMGAWVSGARKRTGDATAVATTHDDDSDGSKVVYLRAGECDAVGRGATYSEAFDAAADEYDKRWAQKRSPGRAADVATTTATHVCLECKHPECPVVPDCSACPKCTAEKPRHVTVECPKCSAPAGEDCRSTTPAKRRFPEGHTERHERLRQVRAVETDAPPDRESAPARGADIDLRLIRRDGNTQSRADMNVDAIADYSEADKREPGCLPPVHVFAIAEGKKNVYLLADGFHRVAARERNGRASVSAIVHRGDQREAFLFGCRANRTHGLRLTNADKRFMLSRVFADEAWRTESDRWIAEQVGVSHEFVRQERARVLGQVSTVDTSRVGKDGKTYPASQPSRVDYDGEGHPSDTAESDDSIGSTSDGPNPSGDPLHNAGACIGCGGSTGIRTPDGKCSACEPGSFQAEYPFAYVGLRRAVAEDLRDGSSSARSPLTVGEQRAYEQAALDLDPGKRPAATPAPPPKQEERPAKRTWRETLGLPQTGSLGPLEVVAAFEAAWSEADSRDTGRRQALMRAKAFGLSQWHTKPELAAKMAELSNVGRLAEMRAAVGGAPFRILEPSAGIGGICTAIRRVVSDRKTIHVTAHEVDPHRCTLLRRHGDVDEVIEGDFLSSPRASDLFDLAVANTPSERGLDGLFLEEMMARCLRVVALLRVNALCGAGRLERVWSQVQRREWDLLGLRFLSERPAFLVGAEIEAGEVESDEGAQSDYCVVYLARIPETGDPEPAMAGVDWWPPTRARSEGA